MPEGALIKHYMVVVSPLFYVLENGYGIHD